MVFKLIEQNGDNFCKLWEQQCSQKDINSLYSGFTLLIGALWGKESVNAEDIYGIKGHLVIGNKLS